MNRTFICDMESDGLLDTITKIHCLSLGWTKDGVFKVQTTKDYEQMRKIITDENITLIGHNFYLFDILALERVLGVKHKCQIKDSLGLSWYLEPTRMIHNLESYAIEYGMNKVEVEIWDGEGPEFDKLMKERCEHDVRIQNILWNNQMAHILELYEGDQDEANRIIDYISFKLDCIYEQANTGVKLDEELSKKTLLGLLEEKDAKITILTASMPKVAIKAIKKMPAKMYNNKDELSSIGMKWVAFLKEQGLPITHVRDVTYIKGWEEPNPNSHTQIKDWLFSLGWTPENMKFTRNKKTGEISQVPQIKSKADDGTLCPSVLKLIPQAPALEELNGLGIINHRITVFNGLLRDAINGRVHQGIGGFTNTMRLTHRTIVNLPKISVPYGKEIRGSLITDSEDTVLCGTDLSNIESMTRNHYMYPFDPSYVDTLMNDKDFDSHLDIALLANMMSKEDVDFFVEYKKSKEHTPEETERFHHLNDLRSKAKTVNFAALYGVSAKTLSRNSGMTLKQSETILKIYWERNKAVLDFVASVVTQNVRGQLWAYNPISKFWYSLRNDRDIFSTVNQSSAVYCMDLYIKYTRKQGIKIAFQVHDEMSFNLEKGKEEEVTTILKKAIKQTNDELKLNIVFGSSIDFGNRYSEIH